MRKLVVKEWMTLDGIIDADTMDEWWNPYDSAERQALITEGYMGCDGYLLGRVTYELLAPTWARLEDHYLGGLAGKLRSIPKYVVSSTLKHADWGTVTIINGNVVEAIAQVKQQAGTYIVLDGSATLARALMDADLIDEYRFLVLPYIMGTGKRFFNEETPTTRLKLVNTQTLPLGVVALTYQPNKA